MTTEQKLNKLKKLIDLLIEYSESGETMADLNLKLYGIKSENTKEECMYCKREKQLDMDQGSHHFRCTPVTTSEDTITAQDPGDVMGAIEMMSRWQPKPGNGYWVIHPSYNSPQHRFWGSPSPTTGELVLWKLGVVFETEQEAVDYFKNL